MNRKKSGKKSAAQAVRLGIAGMGNMGQAHARSILAGNVPGVWLTAICDEDRRRCPMDAEVRAFTDARAMIRSGEIDAILVATPHYSHTTIGIDALEQGLHVLMEKPISVHKRDC